MPTTFTLSATLQSPSRPVANLRVEAWDENSLCPDLVDVARTDERGHFEMRLDADYVSDLIPRRQPSVTFRVFDGHRPVSLARRVVWQIRSQITRLQLPLAAADDPQDAKNAPGTLVVRGTVLDAEGAPVSKHLVRAFDRDLSPKGLNHVLLGQAHTDAGGHYEIRYVVPPARGKIKPDLVVRGEGKAPSAESLTAAAADTVVHFSSSAEPGVAAQATPVAPEVFLADAPTTATVDFGTSGAVEPQLSEYRQVMAKLAPVLARGGVELSVLTAEGTTFAARSARIQADRVELVVRASQLEHEMKGSVPAEIFYGLLRLGTIGSLQEIGGTPQGSLRKQLEAAIAQNLVSASFGPRLADILAGLQRRVASDLLDAKGANGATSIADVLATSLSSRATQNAFLERWLAREGNVRAFWKALRDDTTFPQGAADDLQFTMRLGALFEGHMPALVELSRLRKDKSVGTLRDIARWDDGTWQAFLARIGGAPAGEGTPEERAKAYLSGIKERLHRLFPTEHLRQKARLPRPPVATRWLPAIVAQNPGIDPRSPLPDDVAWGDISTSDRDAAADEWDAYRREALAFRSAPAAMLLEGITKNGGKNPAREAARAMLLDHPEVDFEKEHVETTLAKNPKLLDGVAPALQGVVIDHLKATQRVLRIAQKPEAVERLLEDGLDSGLRIARVSRADFVERYADVLGGEAAARRAHVSARRQAATAQIALTTVAQSLLGASPWAVRGGAREQPSPAYQSVVDLLQGTSQGTADRKPAAAPASWPKLFGREGFCACEECQSIYSPGAYLVDLLHMLDHGHGKKNPVQHLFARRGDLAFLKLSCANTNTPLPAIDLVNEVLERYIALLEGKAGTHFSYDTGKASAAELRATPQHVRSDVYEILAERVYPFTLPFHRPLAVARGYIEQLGTTYRDVLEAFGPPEGADGLTAEDRIAAETLGLSSLQFRLIAGDTPELGVARAYGLGASEDPTAVLAQVPALMRRTGVTYDELVQLVRTFFVNPLQSDAAKAIWLDPPKDCQIAGTRVNNVGPNSPNPDVWARIHRFVRLRRALGWTIADLDRAIFTLGERSSGAAVLDRQTLRRLALVRRAETVLERPLATLLALWGDIDTWGDDALFLRLFPDDAFTLAYGANGDANLKPPSGSFELSHSDRPLTKEIPALLAALRISGPDLHRIWDHAHAVGAIASRTPAGDEPRALLRLHELSVLYRTTVLAKGLGLRIPDLVALLALSGLDPFAPRDPKPTLELAALARKVETTGMSVATLAYIYRHQSEPAQGPAPADGAVLQAVMAVWAALRAVRQETELAEDAEGTLLRARLSVVLAPDAVTPVVDALDPSKPLADDPALDAARRRQLFADQLGPYLSDAEREGLVLPATPPPTEEARAEKRRANRDMVLRVLSAWLRRTLSRSAVVSVTAATLGIEEVLARRLLEEWISGDGGSGSTASKSFLGLAGGAIDVELFEGADLQGPSTHMTAAAIQLRVTAGAAARSARWTGRLLPLGGGEHVLVVRSNGVARLWIDGQPVTLEGSTGAQPGAGIVVDQSAKCIFSLGALPAITVEYESGGAPGGVEVLWRLATTPAAVPIAAEHLFPTAAPATLDAPGRGPGFAWRRMHKAALLVSGLGLSERELVYAQSDDAAFGSFRLGELPMKRLGAAAVHAQLARWELLADFVAVRRSIPAAETSLVDVLEGRLPAMEPADGPAAWVDRLCDATGWSAAAVRSLLDESALDAAAWSTLSGSAILARVTATMAGPLATNGALDVGRRLAAIQRCLDLSARLGVAVRPTLAEWAAREPSADTAREIVLAVRGRYEEDAQWLEVARAKNDVLREAQRDALVAYLLPRMKIADRAPKDADELFEFFLIDVQTTAKAETSRVRQAIASVQLFVQRCLLGLEEPDVAPSAIDAELWPWWKNYRVWEANRKIFVEPEAYIEPELREGKSPFFEDLEASLRQNQLDDANVEQAFVDYLEKLDKVARLEVCATHWQREDDDDPDKSVDILHVIARSPGVPAIFWYRTLLDGQEWTPWEKIDLDIDVEGESGNVHMVLQSHDRRLYLFWAVFSEKPEPRQPGATEGDSPDPALTHWEIRLAWSTYHYGRWSAKRLSDDFVESPRFITQKDFALYPDAERELKQELALVGRPLDHARTALKIVKLSLGFQLGRLSDHLKAVLDSFHRGDPLPVPRVWLIFQGADFDVFEANLETWDVTFTKWLTEVYDWLDAIHRLGPVKKADLQATYDQLTEFRKQRDEALADYEEVLAAKESFEDGQSALAIPRLRRRVHHTFWAHTDDGLSVAVLRHPSSGKPRKIGTFTLASDGRSVRAESAEATETSNLSRLTPARSTARFNAFRIPSSAQKGLDFSGLPDLLGDAAGALVVGEHWTGNPPTAQQPRPFFVSKGQACHVALPNPPEDEEEPKRASFGALPAFSAAAESAEPTIHLVDLLPKPVYRFEAFHHPYVLSMIRSLNRGGVSEALTLDTKKLVGEDAGTHTGKFATTFEPSFMVGAPYPPHDIDFRAQGAYSVYNWEFFFHAPFLIAVRLMQDGRYEKAREWFHTIFDPTTDAKGTGAKRFWKLDAFRESDATKSAQDLLTALADSDAPAGLVDGIRAQIEQWMRHPASPHRIAALRLSAYQKAVVYRYLDNLIAWADSLFTQDTMESINEATQLYVLASHLLGARPERVAPTSEPIPLDYASLRGDLDELSHLLVDVENLVFPYRMSGASGAHAQISSLIGIGHIPGLKQAAAEAVGAEAGPARALCFCVPPSEKLLGYWDTLEDRLFKIRHAMNIEGVERLLPLFEPPIDPALLVRAAAAGLDIGSVLSDLSAPRAHHRFPVMLQKALELAGEVRSLGGSLLAALEKRDAESLAMLRATHETTLTKAVRDVRRRQIDEAIAAKTALEKTRAVVEARYDYYTTRPDANPGEVAQLVSMGVAGAMQFIAGAVMPGAAASDLVLDLEIGPTGMGAHATAKYGGSNAAKATKSVSEWFNIIAQTLHTQASMAGILGGYERRQDEWDHQATLAKKELAQIDKQLAAADIRIAIATHELQNQELSIANSTKVEEILRTKYTNEQLYAWMVQKTSEVHYQAYRLAYDLAKRAERGYRFEMGLATSSFIRFGTWDSLKKGLLAGEQLALDLRRLDAAYLEGSRRDYEVTRHVSLVLHDPAAFIALRETGSCEVDLGEELFDGDYPGHFDRRIKTVSITLPCIAGPYTPINCTLTLLRNSIRTSSSAGGEYAEQDAPNDLRFSRDFGSIQSVATSHGQNDGGLFEVNFRDDRYLPFEGAGAISRWRIELPKGSNAFDFETLSDVVLRLSYTARDGGKPLADAARKSLQKRRAEPRVSGESGALRRLFRLRYEFSDAWLAFRRALATGDGTLSLTIDKERFPYVFRNASKKIEVVEVQAFLDVSSDDREPLPATVELRLGPPEGPAASASLMHGRFSWKTQAGVGIWTLSAAPPTFPVERVKDVLLLITYTVAT